MDVKTTIQNQRILSGMRLTGRLHLGHLHGVLHNWISLQHQYECFFSVANWHALTTHYENPSVIQAHLNDMVIDWLAAGVDPGSAHIFIQSQIPEIAELHLLLSMAVPLGWLERVPTYKDQKEKLADKNIDTYGFLGYPLLQAADILIIKSALIPVGEDQVPHIELAREIARRFNHLYGRESGYAEKAEAAISKLGKKAGKLYRDLLRRYQEQGELDALEKGRALLESQQNISVTDSERLYGYIEGGGRIILPEPSAMLTPTPRFPGLDGQKMSKSYGNTIALRETPDVVEEKIRTMPTDPARVKRTDPGQPEKCPVWEWHKIYSNDEVKEWVQTGCRSAGIGCIECKHVVSEAVIKEQAPILERGKNFEENPGIVRQILAEGREAAREVAQETIEEVREAMQLDYDYE